MFLEHVIKKHILVKISVLYSYKSIVVFGYIKQQKYHILITKIMLDLTNSIHFEANTQSNFISLLSVITQADSTSFCYLLAINCSCEIRGAI